MPEPDSIAAIRAAVDTIAPPTDGRPGAADLGVHEHVIAVVEQAFPGFTDLTAVLLDAYAGEVAPGTLFVDLTADDRASVLRSMSSDQSGDIRDAVDALFIFTLGGMYSEWTGYDRETGALRPVDVWKDMGFRGPVHGHPEYR